MIESGGESADKLNVKSSGMTSTPVQIFWPQDGDYSERALTGMRCPMGQWTRVILDLPAQRANAVLRFDPCAQPGTVFFSSIRLADAQDRKTGIIFRTESEIESLSLEELVPIQGGSCLTVVSVGTDPKIFLPPLPRHLSGKPLRFEVWIRIEASQETALRSLKPLAKSFSTEPVSEERRVWLENLLRRVRQQALTSSGRSQQTLGDLEAALRDAESRLEDEKSTSRFLNAELARVRSDLDWSRNEMDRLRKENDRRKLALRDSEHTIQFKWTLPAFLMKRRKGKIVETGGFEFHLETPKSFNLINNSATLVGWCFAKSGDYIQAIRATVGSQKFEGQYGRKRFDVKSIFPNYGNSDRSGFEIEVRDLPSKFNLIIEVLDDHNTWHVLRTIEGRVARSVWASERGAGVSNSKQPVLEQLMELTSKEQRMFQREVAGMNFKPVVSIIMPVFNTPVDYLREAVKSVMAQAYPHWQLCIADDASTSQATLDLLKEIEKWDKRILVHRCSKNGGIAAASNAALGLATGDFIALMDHDDLLTPLAVLRVVQAYLGNGADFIYSDEGHITPSGEFMGGIYRPAFSPAYLRSHPYIVHLVAFSARLLREIGGFNEELTISQDYDLILRAVEKAQTIVHIPEILYLWRQLPSSGGHVLQDKVMDTSVNVLQNHARRMGDLGTVMPGFSFNFFRIRPKVDLEKTSLAVIIPTKNQASFLERCVRSLEQTLPDKLPWRLVIVDHESNEPDAKELLSSLAARHTVLPYAGNFNYSAINNFAVRHGAGNAEHILLCNNDIEATEPEWLERLLELSVDERVGAVGPMLLYPDGQTIQHAGVSVGLSGPAEHLGKFMLAYDEKGKDVPGYQGLLKVTREVAALTAACALVKRRAFEAIQGFNEELQVGFNDTDLFLRLWKNGYRVLYTGETSLLHHESATRGKSFTHDPHPADSRRFLNTWGWLITRGDPFYNPNLRADSTAWESSFSKAHASKPKMRVYTEPSSMFKE